MLIFVLLLIASVHFYQVSCINLTYIVKKTTDNTVYPSCVAEENVRYLGIGWIYPIPDTKDNLPETISKYLPTISNNNYKCNFSKYNKCNKVWQLKNWQKTDNLSKIFDYIVDERWEDFPIIFTSKIDKEFNEKIEVPNSFELTFSLRASSSVEIFVCEGWNPYIYPCYHLNISKNDIFLRKFSATPKVMNDSTNVPPIDVYKAVSNIITEEEWRTFILKFDNSGQLTLKDTALNRIVIEFNDEQPLKPFYFLMRSQDSALWKIHQNYFIYTNSSQTSRLGPTIELSTKDLCVALFVSTCSNCAMTFLIVDNNEKIVLEQVPPTNNKWRPIKLKKENILNEKVNIFVETKVLKDGENGTENDELFWAIDDVRICHENEVRVTSLKLKTNLSEENVEKLSCQVVQHSKWRPKKFEYTGIEEMPEITTSSTSDSIVLSWDLEYSPFPINYFIYYSANDICPSYPHNLRRIKSNGFLMTKNSEIEIKNLVPYTNYDITFTSLLHEKEKILHVTTEETDKPTVEELPNKVQIQVTETMAYVSWEKVDCKSIYGHIIYVIKVKDYKETSTKFIKNQTENNIEVKNLRPYSNYSIEIITLRKLEEKNNNDNNYGMIFNFTTLPGVPPKIENLEIYASDNDSIYLRYNLPKDPRGVPIYLQITRCNPYSTKCKSTVQPIEKCPIWPNKYCINVKNLIPNQKYKLQISIKNENTHTFGKEAIIEGFTGEKVPAAPTNVTYKIVDCKEFLDYCHLNLSWLHPYYQNGSITAFDIILNSTNNNISENIQEVFRTGKIYQPKYDYQIKYVPYSAHYELYIQSVNTQYKSEYTNIHVKTANIGDVIDQSPKLIERNENSLTLQVPHVDSRLKSYKLTVIVQDYDKTKTISKELMEQKNISQDLCLDYGNTWIAQSVEIDNSTTLITIGNDTEDNPYLKPNTSYCLTFIVTNFYKNSQHNVVYYEKLQTSNETTSNDNEIVRSKSNKHLYGLLLLILLIPLGYFIYKFIMKKQRPKRRRENNENVYESMPFEDCDDNAISNQTYDELMHK